MGNNKGRKQEIELAARFYMAELAGLLLVPVFSELLLIRSTPIT